MAWLRTHTKQHPGKPIVARTLREMAETCDWATRIQANPPLSIQSTAMGATLRLAGFLFGAYVCIAQSPGITARVTTTPGTGTASILTWNGTSLALLLDESSNPIAIKVYSISSTTGGIPSGTYMIALRICGAYWVISVDCGN